MLRENGEQPVAAGMPSGELPHRWALQPAGGAVALPAPPQQLWLAGRAGRAVPRAVCSRAGVSSPGGRQRSLAGADK